MKYSQNSAFTLIEMIIAITIVVLMSIMAFAPYSYYLNKSKVKHTQKEVSQLIYEAKNMALNGIVWVDKNISVWVYFDINDNSRVELLSFPYDLSFWNLTQTKISDAQSIEPIATLTLQPGIQFEEMWWESKWIIYFQAISASWWVKTWESFTSYTWDTQLVFSYKWANNGPLRQSIQYIQDTQIVDY